MAMEIFLLGLGGVCLLAGLAGAILPTPGVSLSFLGLLFIHFSEKVELDKNVLFLLGALTLLVIALDYYVPIWGTKKWGGSKYGATGATIGLLAGLFFTPIGMLMGAFLGAFLGELLGGRTLEIATKAAFGAFLGFLSGVFMQVALCLVMIYYAVVAIFF